MPRAVAWLLLLLWLASAGLLASQAGRRGWGPGETLLAFAGFVLASAIPFVFGIPYMAFILNVVGGGTFGLGEILAFGLWPFVIGGIVKAAIAAVLIPAAWAGVRAADRSARR